MTDRVVKFCLENRLIVGLLALLLVGWGLVVAPFDWKLDWIERRPVAVDAIPDTGDNQQIVFTQWDGHSPQDVEDQITYPLTSALLGLPGVKSIRSSSSFGFSSIYVIFDDSVEFYWSRSRILEKLASLPQDALPSGVQPRLGPDATALGQVFWYTIEGRDEAGNPTGGWDLEELRSVQDWQARYALQAVEGVSEVASVGGFVKEYQVDVDPDALRVFGVTLQQVYQAVRDSNHEVGAKTIEINQVEYLIRGLGFVRSLEDLRQAVVMERDGVPVTLEQLAEVELGPATRRGVLDKGGVEAVGGVVVARFGANPLETIQRVKQQIERIEPGLPSKTLADGRVSRLKIVPFYDRSVLIGETLDTLEIALRHQILVTGFVVLLMVMRLRSAALISSVLPLAVLTAFVAMSLFGVDANVVALSGIAIAIGTIVDLAVVLVENCMRRLEESPEEESRRRVIFKASTEVSGAILTAVLTTVVSFLPVFTMVAEEGRLFRPLAFTKTFTLLGSILLALTVVPALAYTFFGSGRLFRSRVRENAKVGPDRRAGRVAGEKQADAAGPAVRPYLGNRFGGRFFKRVATILVAIALGVLLALDWEPLGPHADLSNVVFTLLLLGGGVLLSRLLVRWYSVIMAWILERKAMFLTFCFAALFSGVLVWLGWSKVFAFAPDAIKRTDFWKASAERFPGLGREFMPALDEGAFLFMPSVMSHASIGIATEVLSLQNQAIQALPEVEDVVGKVGRVESALDPAPLSMIETVVTYKSEYKQDDQGRILRFAWNEVLGEFERDAHGELVLDDHGSPFRQWRDEVRSAEDIWNEIERVARMPGVTSAPKLQPIETRRIMLQSGLRSPMGLKIFGPDLETLDEAGRRLEEALQRIPVLRRETVFADRTVGKPYLEIEIDRTAIARYGISMRQAQDAIDVAIGGRRVMQTIEGRERYPARVRYQRERRDSIEELERILIASPDGTQIPITQLASIAYRRGPQMIRSENSFLLSYVLFDKQSGLAEVEVVETVAEVLREKRASGELVLPQGVRYEFAGAYQNQVRAAKTLRLVLPVALIAIWILIYLQFRSVGTTFIVFSGVFFAWSGGFVLLWLYGQDWFLDFSFLGSEMRELFQVKTINLSVAVWVGFLALFGIATDDGVLICTYLRQVFAERSPSNASEIRRAVVEAGVRRIRPAMMTSATTFLALLPIMTSTGRGSDVMQPMALPIFGGMLFAVCTVFFAPTLYCLVEELKLKRTSKTKPLETSL